MFLVLTVQFFLTFNGENKTVFMSDERFFFPSLEKIKELSDTENNR